MSAGPAISKLLESEIVHVLEIMEHMRDRPGRNEADTKAAFVDPIPSALAEFGGKAANGVAAAEEEPNR